MLSFRSFIYLALFNLAIGVFLVLGCFTDAAHEWCYQWPVRWFYGDDYMSFQVNGLDPSGNFKATPFDYSTPAEIPVITLNEESVLNTFASYPPAPMDLAVLFYQLRTQGIDKLVLMSPLVWEQKPGPVVSEAVMNELTSYKTLVVGQALTLSARGDLFPKEWQGIVLSPDQFAGDSSKLPPANKLFGETPQLPVHRWATPSIIENDSLFRELPREKLSAPLFVRWGDAVLPTLPLMAALDILDLQLAEVHVQFGGMLRLGDKKIIPIDSSGRIQLRPGTDAVSLPLSDVVTLEGLPQVVQSTSMNPVKAMLENAACVLVEEPSPSTSGISQEALLAARTIRNLISGISEQPPMFFPQSTALTQWILLIDILLVAVFSLHFGGMIRRTLLGIAATAPILASVILFAHDYEWFPFIPPLAAVLLVVTCSPFIKPVIIASNGNNLSEESQLDSETPTPAMPTSEPEFHEPDAIPIPNQSSDQQLKTSSSLPQENSRANTQVNQTRRRGKRRHKNGKK